MKFSRFSTKSRSHLLSDSDEDDDDDRVIKARRIGPERTSFWAGRVCTGGRNSHHLLVLGLLVAVTGAYFSGLHWCVIDTFEHVRTVLLLLPELAWRASHIPDPNGKLDVEEVVVRVLKNNGQIWLRDFYQDAISRVAESKGLDVTALTEDLKSLKNELSGQIARLQRDLDSVKSATRPLELQVERLGAEMSSMQRQIRSFVSEHYVKQMVSELQHQRCADEPAVDAHPHPGPDPVGRLEFDFASGGRVVQVRPSDWAPPYQDNFETYYFWGIPIWRVKTNDPALILGPAAVSAGHCWAFKNSSASVVIQLSHPIWPESVSVEHVPVSMTPDKQILSAPKNFTVHSLEATDADAQFLGAFLYDSSKAALQNFRLNAASLKGKVQLIEFRIGSNHGHPNYTCLYRVQVHGRVSI